ncbi:MAG: hypothetical protein AAGA58_02695 [Verrucomicrobiota bacterium]
MSEINHESPAEPFIGTCAFCEQGKLRLWVAGRKPVALCDECELFWEDIPGVFADPQIPSSGSFPEGSDGADSPQDWRAAAQDEIDGLELSQFVIGQSV